MRKIVLPFAVLAFAIGCQSPKPALHVSNAPAQLLPAGWTDAASPDGAVKVGIPSGWRYGVDRMGGMPDLQNLGLSEGDMANPEVQQLTQQAETQGAAEEKQRLEELAKKGIVLHVINGSKPIVGESRTRFVVQRYDQSSNWSLDEAADAERKQYARKPGRQDVTLPIGKAVKLSASEELRTGNTRHLISYLAADGKKLYVLRFITEETKESIQSIADSVAETWRIQPTK